MIVLKDYEQLKQAIQSKVVGIVTIKTENWENPRLEIYLPTFIFSCDISERVISSNLNIEVHRILYLYEQEILKNYFKEVQE